MGKAGAFAQATPFEESASSNPAISEPEGQASPEPKGQASRELTDSRGGVAPTGSRRSEATLAASCLEEPSHCLEGQVQEPEVLPC